MTAPDLAILLFAACNTLRVFAYVPQLYSVCRDRNGASAISYTTWALFSISNASTVAYALYVLGDDRMAAVFGANAAFCLMILCVTLMKRTSHRRSSPSSAPGLRTG